MIYSSLIFIYAFLPLSLLVYYLCPDTFREYALLFISLVYCVSWGTSYLIFMAIYAAMNYAGCLLIQKLRPKGRPATVTFAVCVLADIAAMFGFRSEFSLKFADMLGMPYGFFPIGISFFTLSAIGTLSDVYIGRVRSAGSFARFALYITYFPRLVMGPIVRYDSFGKLVANRKAGLASIGMGLSIFIKGLVKKVVAADILYMLYTAVKSTDIGHMSAMTAWLGVIAYILCLYFTFSGFADMGVGISRCFGIKLPPSLNYPLFSTKVRAFASNWNIQLTLWFRRYFFKPLASLRKDKFHKRVIFALAWIMIGLWYKFDLKGLVWGVISAAAILFENRFIQKKSHGFTGIFYTVIFAVIGGVFFLNDGFADSFEYLFTMFGRSGILVDELSFYLLKSYIVLILAAVYASTSLFRNMIVRAEKTGMRSVIDIITPVFMLVLLMLCTAFISYGGSSDMILIRL